MYGARQILSNLDKVQSLVKGLLNIVIFKITNCSTVVTLVPVGLFVYEKKIAQTHNRFPTNHYQPLSNLFLLLLIFLVSLPLTLSFFNLSFSLGLPIALPFLTSPCNQA